MRGVGWLIPNADSGECSREVQTQFCFIKLKITHHWDAWVVQLVKRPTLAQVMILQSVSSSPKSSSVLTARSLEPASDSVSPSLSAPPLLMLCLSLWKNK